MAKVVVRNIDPRIDGEYELFTADQWTHEEWHRVKKLTGLKVGDFIKAEEDREADADVLFAIAVVSCERASKPNAANLLKQGRLGDIELEGDPEDEETEIGEKTDDGDDAVPPVSASTGSGPVSVDVSQTTGPNTSESSDPSENPLSAIGALT